MTENIIAGLIFVAGIINFLPLIGVRSKAKFETLYGLKTSDSNTEILIRHRAIMFGLLGSFMMFAAFHPHLQILAIIGGLISMVTFIILAQMISGYTDHIRKVVIADIIGILGLLIAAGLMIK